MKLKSKFVTASKKTGDILEKIAQAIESYGGVPDHVFEKIRLADRSELWPIGMDLVDLVIKPVLAEPFEMDILDKPFTEIVRIHNIVSDHPQYMCESTYQTWNTPRYSEVGKFQIYMSEHPMTADQISTYIDRQGLVHPTVRELMQIPTFILQTAKMVIPSVIQIPRMYRDEEYSAPVQITLENHESKKLTILPSQSISKLTKFGFLVKFRD